MIERQHRDAALGEGLGVVAADLLLHARQRSVDHDADVRAVALGR